MKKSLCFFLFLVILALAIPFSASAATEEPPIESIKAVLETMFEDVYYAKIDCNETGVIIRTSDEGIGTGVLAVEFGLADYEVWADLRTVTVDFANSIYFFLKECGIKDPNLLYVIVDDWTQDTIFLAIYNGKIVYDYLPNK